MRPLPSRRGPLPSSTFAGILRSRYDYRLSPAGLQRAADIATAMGAAAADSAAGGPPGTAPGVAPAPGLQPAPGGPPVGGAPQP